MSDTQEQKTDLSESLVGQTFEGRFEILSVLGRGGMGMVYKARHIHMDKIVAVKTLVQNAVFDDTSFLRFEGEARTASSLEHPNIISIFDFGRSVHGFAYLVMEYINGLTLEDIIVDSETESITIPRFLRVFKQACDGMQHAHKKGVIHRDLKPSNLMVFDSDEEKDKIKIVDFGLAKLAQNDSQNLTQSGVVMGSPLYMSPEQGRGDELDSRSDIYSLGCVMYVSLCGHVPLKGPNSMATIYKHIQDAPPQLSHVAPYLNLPRRLEQVVMRTLEKDPNLRPQTMAELGYEIEEAITSTDSTKPMPGARTPDMAKTAASASTQKPEAIPLGSNANARAAAKPSASIPNLAIVAVVLGLTVLAGGFAFMFNRPQAPVDSENKLVSSLTGTDPAKGSTGPIPTNISEAAPSSKNAATTSASSSVGDEFKSVGSNSAKNAGTDSSKTTGAVPSNSTEPSNNKAADPANSTPAIKNAAVSSTALSDQTSGSKLASAAQEKREVKSEKQIALDLIKQYQKEAAIATRSGDPLEALSQLDKSLEQERIAYGKDDPHLLPTLTKLLDILPKGQDGRDRRITYVDNVLRVFDKNRDAATAYLNEKDRSAFIYKTYGIACTDLAKSVHQPSVKHLYFQWAAIFFEYARHLWRYPHDQEYFQMLRFNSLAAKLTGQEDLSRELNHELLQNGQMLPELGQQNPGFMNRRPGQGPGGQMIDQGRQMMRRRRFPQQFQQSE